MGQAWLRDSLGMFLLIIFFKIPNFHRGYAILSPIELILAEVELGSGQVGFWYLDIPQATVATFPSF